MAGVEHPGDYELPEFPVEVVVGDTPHKVGVEWDWHDMAGAITPPGARLVITVTLLDQCRVDPVLDLLQRTAPVNVTTCPTCGGEGTVAP